MSLSSGWISCVTDTPCSPSFTSARTVMAMSRLRRHSTGSSSSYRTRRDLRQRHHRALARVEVDVLQRVEVQALRRHRARHDVDQVLALAQLRQRRAVHHASASPAPRRPASGRAHAPCPGRARPSACAPGRSSRAAHRAPSGLAATTRSTSRAISRTICVSGPTTRNCTGKPTGGPSSSRVTRTHACGNCLVDQAISRERTRSRASRSLVITTNCA